MVLFNVEWDSFVSIFLLVVHANLFLFSLQLAWNILEMCKNWLVEKHQIFGNTRNKHSVIVDKY
jgi:hypothetical protein